jgi:hypothetical protein
MSKVFVRKCERYTVWEASEPIEVDVEKLRNCVPPFEGETEEDLLEYLKENVYYEEEWAENETNKEVYGEDESYDLTMVELYDMEVYSDTRDKYAQEWIDVGVPNDEWRKMGRFEVKATNVEEA